MPHEVETLAYVNNTNLARTGVPWHGIGEAHDGWLTDEQAKRAIGFEVVKQPLYRLTAPVTLSSGLVLPSQYIPLDDAQETVRIDGDIHIGTVGSDYEVFPGEELIELGSILVDDWGAKWDTAAVLKGGRIIFATLRLDIVSGEGRGLAALDDSDYYTWLLLASSHDASHGVTGDVVNVRTVCKNTFNSGRARAKSGWAVKHTGDVSQRAREAHRTIGLVTQRQKEFTEFAEQMAESQFVLDDFDAFAESVFPATKPRGEEKPGKVAQGNATKRREAVKENWLTSETIPNDLRFTKWGLLNATTEWAEHLRIPRANNSTPVREQKMLSTLFGGPVQQIRDRATGYLGRVDSVTAKAPVAA